jgi:hypothetical protein
MVCKKCHNTPTPAQDDCGPSSSAYYRLDGTVNPGLVTQGSGSSSDDTSVYVYNDTDFTWPTELPATDAVASTDRPLTERTDLTSDVMAGAFQGVVIGIVLALLNLIQENSTVFQSCLKSGVTASQALSKVYAAAGAKIADLTAYWNFSYNLLSVAENITISSNQGEQFLDAVLALLQAELCCADKACYMKILRNALYPTDFWVQLFDGTNGSEAVQIVIPGGTAAGLFAGASDVTVYCSQNDEEIFTTSAL